jgi:hypothetical protein
MAVEIPRFLTSAQGDLVRETEPARMASLDEDDLLDLHIRVRRARSKYVKLYRQTGAARVGLKGARGHARPGNVGNAAKAAAAPSTRRRATKTTGGLKRDASSRAKGAARQARKDSR